MKSSARRPLRAMICTAAAAMAILGQVACSSGSSGGGGGPPPTVKVTYEGQRLQTAGGPMNASRELMMVVGKSANGRDVFVMKGGGGGGTVVAADEPLYIEVGPNQFQVLVPEPKQPLNRK